MFFMSRVYVGTSGYSYQDWVGPFYPPGMQASDYLEFYGREFGFVELNFSYYRQPDAYMLRKMCAKTPSGFLFTVKAHQSITHEINDDLLQNLEIYKKGIMPLQEAEKLGAVLLQFPYSFHYTAENRKHLDYLSKHLSELPLAVEFRNVEWQKEQVLSELRARGIGFVNVDTPELPGLPGAAETVSGDLAYVRFHGRNKKMWWKGDNTSRYDYLYSDAELTEWVDRIRKILEKAKVLFIAFNNHSRGQAVSNARSMKKLLETSV
jgi:uncharacterized protein YecE (DUF72 family)